MLHQYFFHLFYLTLAFGPVLCMNIVYMSVRYVCVCVLGVQIDVAILIYV